MVSARCGERERERERDRERVFGFPMRALALLLVFGSTGSTANMAPSPGKVNASIDAGTTSGPYMDRAAFRLDEIHALTCTRGKF